MTQLKPYPKYKDSGVEWIGKIPKDWKTVKLKYIGVFSSSGIDKKVDKNLPLVKIINYIDVYNNKSLKLKNSKDYMIVSATNRQISEHVLEEGDLIFTPSSETIEDLGVSAVVYENLVNTCFSYHVLRFQFFKKLDKEYKKYLCNNHYVLSRFSSLASGTIRKTLNRDDFNNTRVFLPTLKEQEKIANYLDKKKDDIDTLIKTKKHLIDLLEEKRQAIITETVTKGLNPNVQMKDSGIEWIGEIPEHWEVVKLKFIGQAIMGLNYKPQEVTNKGKGKLVLRASNIQDGQIEIDRTDNVYVNKEIPDTLITRKNDILICARSGSKELIGKSAVIDEKSINESFGAFTTIYRSEFNDFVSYVFQSGLFQSQIGTYLTSTINQLTMSNLRNLEIIFPPIEEQQIIVKRLNRSTSVIKNLINKIQFQISQLQEYRESLIYEAVTGKIDLRDYEVDSNEN